MGASEALPSRQDAKCTRPPLGLQPLEDTVPTSLPNERIDAWLRSRTGWTRSGIAITRQFELPTFPAAIAFVTRVADLAEEMNHHPDIDIRYTKVRMSLSSHDAGGVTERDLKLAEGIEKAAAG
jgi:4a-hydroxytetrahydrobiopterin dehydratase